MFYRSCLLSFLVVLSSCGDDVVRENDLKLHNPASEVSPSTYERWQSIWDGKSWVIALKNLPNADEASKRSFLYELSSTFSQQLGNLSYAETLFQEFERQFQLELFPALPANLLGPSTSPLGFTALRINNESRIRELLNTRFPGWFLRELTHKEFVTFFWTTLEKMPNVAWVEPNLISKTYNLSATGDTNKDLPSEFNQESSNVERLKRIKADAAYKFVKSKGWTANTVNVAVIDTGVDYEHPELKGQMFENLFEKNGQVGVDDDLNGYIDDIYGADVSSDALTSADLAVGWTYCQDLLGAQDVLPGAADLNGAGKACPEKRKADQEQNEPSSGSSCGHGTHVAGIIAAKHNSDGATIGVCSSCKILGLRAAGRKCRVGSDGQVEKENTNIDDIAQVRSFYYILRLKDQNGRPPVHIVNMSIGKFARSRTLAYLTNTLTSNGIIVVAAAGNENTETPSYPAAFSNVISVCAVSNADPKSRGQYAKTDFSNFGEWVDLCAPGKEIESTFPGGGTYGQSGTSQAAPFVAGAAGYLLSVLPTLSREEIERRLLEYANSKVLYDEPKNRLYSGEYPDGSTYYFLGRGLLDLEASVKDDPSRLNMVTLDQDYQTYHVKRGCVVSSVVSSRHGIADAVSSMPIFLGMSYLGYLLMRKNQRSKMRG